MKEFKPKRVRERRENPVSRIMRRTYTIKEFTAAFRVSHSYTYKLINEGRLESFLLGAKRLIVADSAERLMQANGDQVSTRGAIMREKNAEASK